MRCRRQFKGVASTFEVCCSIGITYDTYGRLELWPLGQPDTATHHRYPRQRHAAHSPRTPCLFPADPCAEDFPFLLALSTIASNDEGTYVYVSFRLKVRRGWYITQSLPVQLQWAMARSTRQVFRRSGLGTADIGTTLFAPNTLCTRTDDGRVAAGRRVRFPGNMSEGKRRESLRMELSYCLI